MSDTCIGLLREETEEEESEIRVDVEGLAQKH